MLFVAAITFHIVAPSIVEVFGSWPRVSSVAPAWLAAIVGCEALSFASAIALQRIALRTDAWFSVATSQLAGNAMSQVVPGGAAAGATVQLRLLSRAGIDTATAISGFTAFSLLQTASILFLPVLTLPTILLGAPVERGLAQTAFVGIAGFVVVAALGSAMLTTDPPLRGIGRAVQFARNQMFRKRAPLGDLPATLLHQRNSDPIGARRTLAGSAPRDRVPARVRLRGVAVRGWLRSGASRGLRSRCSRTRPRRCSR